MPQSFLGAAGHVQRIESASAFVCIPFASSLNNFTRGYKSGRMIWRNAIDIQIGRRVIAGIVESTNKKGRIGNDETTLFQDCPYPWIVCHLCDGSGIRPSLPSTASTAIVSGFMWVI